MRDPIDTAIDQVAARMVQVRDDEDLAVRIVARVAGALVAFRLADSAVRGHRRVRDCRRGVDDARHRDAVVVAVCLMWPVMAGMPNTVAAIAPGTAFRTLPLEPLGTFGTRGTVGWC